MEIEGRMGKQRISTCIMRRLWVEDFEYMLMITLRDVYVTIITNYHFADTRDDAVQGIDENCFKLSERGNF